MTLKELQDSVSQAIANAYEIGKKDGKAELLAEIEKLSRPSGVKETEKAQESKGVAAEEPKPAVKKQAAKTKPKPATKSAKVKPSGSKKAKAMPDNGSVLASEIVKKMIENSPTITTQAVMAEGSQQGLDKRAIMTGVRRAKQKGWIVTKPNEAGMYIRPEPAEGNSAVH